MFPNVLLERRRGGGWCLLAWMMIAAATTSRTLVMTNAFYIPSVSSAVDKSFLSAAALGRDGNSSGNKSFGRLHSTKTAAAADETSSSNVVNNNNVASAAGTVDVLPIKRKFQWRFARLFIRLAAVA